MWNFVLFVCICIMMKLECHFGYLFTSGHARSCLKLKRGEMLSPHIWFCRYPIILKVCTEHDNVIAMVCAKFQFNLMTESDIMDKWDFKTFEIKMRFSWISYITTTPDTIAAWISNYIHYKVWDEITYAFPNFNSCTIEVWEWINNSIPHFPGHMINYPCWN